MKEFIFPVEATPRINALIEKLGNGKLERFIAEYVRNGDGNCENTMDFFKQEKIIFTRKHRICYCRKKKRNCKCRKGYSITRIINDLEKTDTTIFAKNLVESENRDFIHRQSYRERLEKMLNILFL